MTTKIMIGVPSWGTQSPRFWQPAMMEVANLYKFGIELVDVANSESMSVDNNRNSIVSMFRKSAAEYLLWWDTDNSMPLSFIPRLLEHKKPLVGPIYFKRSFEFPEPIAYLRQPDGRYQSIPGYRRGEIIRVDAAGMNGLLVHRDVFDEIERNYEILISSWGAMFTVHKDDIQGDILDDVTEVTDNQVIDGQYRIRLYKPPYRADGPDTFPFFQQERNRTEDMPFFEMAARCGIRMFIDTSIECDHYKEEGVNGTHYREWIRHQIEIGAWEDE